MSVPEACFITPGPEHPWACVAHGGHHRWLTLRNSFFVWQVVGKRRYDWMNTLWLGNGERSVASTSSWSLNRQKHCSKGRLSPTVCCALNGLLWAGQGAQSMFLGLLLKRNMFRHICKQTGGTRSPLNYSNVRISNFFLVMILLQWQKKFF